MFGDGNTADEQNPTHSYSNEGNYTVVLSVTDAEEMTVRDTTWALIGGSNDPPDTPDVQGPAKGKPLLTYKYTFVATDPDLDAVFYFVDWGDNTSSGWLGPYGSGVQVSAMHNWTEKGTYTVRVKAKDIHEAESDWGVLSVKIPFSSDQPVLSLLERFFQRFPHAFLILRQLMG